MFYVLKKSFKAWKRKVMCTVLAYGGRRRIPSRHLTIRDSGNSLATIRSSTRPLYSRLVLPLPKRESSRINIFVSCTKYVKVVAWKYPSTRNLPLQTQKKLCSNPLLLPQAGCRNHVLIDARNQFPSHLLCIRLPIRTILSRAPLLISAAAMD